MGAREQRRTGPGRSDLARVVLILLVLVAPLSAGAEHEPDRRYSRAAVQWKAATAEQAGRWAADVDRRAKTGPEFDRLAPLGAPGEALTAAMLPPHAARALRVLDCSSGRPTVRQLLVPVTDEQRFPVTIRCASEAVAEVAWAKAPWHPPTGEGVERATLAERYGMGGVVDGERAWQPSELASLDQALALLTPEELEAIAGLPWVRNRTPSGAIDQPHVAFFSASGAKRAIVVLDGAFGSDATAFRGAVDRPLAASTLVLLHEIGHALARRPGAEAAARSEAAYAEARAAYEQLRAEREAYVARQQPLLDWGEERELLSQRWAEVAKELADGSVEGSTATAEDLASLRAEAQRLIDQMREGDDGLADLSAEVWKRHAELVAKSASSDRSDELAALSRRAQELSDAPPVLTAYAAVPGSRNGPTRYGLTNVGEGFAEAFALFKTSPAQLAWVAPDVHRWFEEGNHLLRTATAP